MVSLFCIVKEPPCILRCLYVFVKWLENKLISIKNWGVFLNHIYYLENSWLFVVIFVGY